MKKCITIKEIIPKMKGLKCWAVKDNYYLIAVLLTKRSVVQWKEASCRMSQEDLKIVRVSIDEI